MTGTWVTPHHYQGDDDSETAIGSNTADFIDLLGGDDTAQGRGGDDNMHGGLGSDTLSGGAGNDNLYDVGGFVVDPGGALGSDHLFGNGGDDQIRIDAPSTGDSVDGGTGTDLLRIDFNSYLPAPTSQPLVFNLGANTGLYIGGSLMISVVNIERIQITGSNGDDTFTGGGLNDLLQGGGGLDKLYGLGGDDIIDPGTGDFIAWGGAGSDILILDFSNDVTGVTLAQSSSMTVVSDDVNGTANGFERLNAQGGSGNDVFTGGDLEDDISTGAGADMVSGRGGDDVIVLGDGYDIAHGGAGYDTFDFQNEAPDPGDAIYGEGDDDTITLAPLMAGGRHTVYGGEGDDGITASSLSDPTSHSLLVGGLGNDVILGGFGQDDIQGDGGNDELSAFGAVHSMLGGDGDDHVSVYDALTTPNQVFDGGDGYDRLALGALTLAGTLDLSDPNVTAVLANGTQISHFEYYVLHVHTTAASTIITGSEGDVLVVTADAATVVKGGGGNDSITLSGTGGGTLQGGADDDQLYAYAADAKALGGLGNDRLYGAAGHQSFGGGSGADTFFFTALADSTVAVAGRDDILDFSHAEADKIDLSAIDANSGKTGNQAFHLVTAFGNHVGELVALADSPGHYLVEGDVDGDGAADFAIGVASSTALVSGDFTL